MNTNSKSTARHERSANILTGLRNHQIEVNGNTINFYEGGQGTTVLLIHGFPNSSADWRNQIPALINAGYRVVAPDLIGLGDSDMPADVEQYTVAKDTENVLAVLDALQSEEMHIVCHDRGTGPGWSIAVSQPERVLSLTSLTVGHLNAWAEGGLNYARNAGTGCSFSSRQRKNRSVIMISSCSKNGCAIIQTLKNGWLI